MSYDVHLSEKTDFKQIITELDNEIAWLNHVRALPTGTNYATPKRRTLSAEARKRIADAQRKRWAKAKRQPNNTPTGG